MFKVKKIVYNIGVEWILEGNLRGNIRQSSIKFCLSIMKDLVDRHHHSGDSK